MDKKLKIAIPVIAGVVAVSTGIGAAFATNSNQPRTAERPAVTYDAGDVTGAAAEDAYPYYCGGFGGMMGYGNGAGFGVTQQLADLLNTTPADLRTQLESGQTLAEIADAQGVTRDQLIETMMAPYNDHIDLMVKYGYVTSDQAVTLRQQAREQLQATVTSQYQEGDWWDYMDEMMDEYGCPGFGWGAPDEAPNGGGAAQPGYGPGGMMNGWGGSTASPGQARGSFGMMGGYGGGFGGMMR
jgi:hypothetical protein